MRNDLRQQLESSPNVRILVSQLPANLFSVVADKTNGGTKPSVDHTSVTLADDILVALDALGLITRT